MMNKAFGITLSLCGVGIMATALILSAYGEKDNAIGLGGFFMGLVPLGLGFLAIKDE